MMSCMGRMLQSSSPILPPLSKDELDCLKIEESYRPAAARRTRTWDATMMNSHSGDYNWTLAAAIGDNKKVPFINATNNNHGQPPSPVKKKTMGISSPFQNQPPNSSRIEPPTADAASSSRSSNSNSSVSMAKTSLLLIKYPPQPQGSRSAATAGTSSSTSSSAQQNSSAAERQTTQQQQKTTKNSASGFFGSRYSRVCRNSPTRPPPPIPTPKPSQFNQSSCSSLINRRRNLLPNTLLGEEIDIDSSSPTAVEEEEEEKGAITIEDPSHRAELIEAGRLSRSSLSPEKKQNHHLPLPAPQEEHQHQHQQTEDDEKASMTSSILANPAWYRDQDGRTGFRSEEWASLPNLQASPIKVTPPPEEKPKKESSRAKESVETVKLPIRPTLFVQPSKRYNPPTSGYSSLPLPTNHIVVRNNNTRHIANTTTLQHADGQHQSNQQHQQHRQMFPLNNGGYGRVNDGNGIMVNGFSSSPPPPPQQQQQNGPSGINTNNNYSIDSNNKMMMKMKNFIIPNPPIVYNGGGSLPNGGGKFQPLRLDIRPLSNGNRDSPPQKNVTFSDRVQITEIYDDTPTEGALTPRAIDDDGGGGEDSDDATDCEDAQEPPPYHHRMNGVVTKKNNSSEKEKEYNDHLSRYRAAEQQQQKVFIPMHRTASNSIDNKSNDKLPSSSSPNNNRPNGTVNNGGGAVWDWRPNHPAMNGQPSATIAGKSVEQLKTGAANSIEQLERVIQEFFRSCDSIARVSTKQKQSKQHTEPAPPINSLPMLPPPRSAALLPPRGPSASPERSRLPKLKNLNNVVTKNGGSAAITRSSADAQQRSFYDNVTPTEAEKPKSSLSSSLRKNATTVSLLKGRAVVCNNNGNGTTIPATNTVAASREARRNDCLKAIGHYDTQAMAACNGHNNNNVIMEKHPMLSNGGSVVRSTSVPVMVNNGMLRQQQTGKKHQPTAAGERQSKKNAVMKSPSHQQLLNGTNSPFATKKSIGGTTKIPILRESSSSSAAVRSASTDVKTTIRKLFR